MLHFQQNALHGKTAGIAGEGAICAKNAVAGHNDPQGIPVTGHSHGTAGTGSADGSCDLPVGSCFPVGNPAQRFPDSDLKGSSAGFKWEIERRPFSRKVFPQLAGRKIGDRGGGVREL